MKLGIICTMINGFGRRGFYNTQEIGLGRELVRQGHAVTIYKCVKKEGAGEAERVELGDRLSILYIPVSSFGAHGLPGHGSFGPGHGCGALLCG